MVTAASAGAVSVLSPAPTASLEAGIPDGLASWGDPVDTDGGKVVVKDGSSVAVYESRGGGWTPSGSLEAPAGASGYFGMAVAVEGDTLVVGDPRFGDDQGRVHVYEEIGGDWQLVQTMAPDEEESAYLGVVVEIDDGHIAAEAYWDTSTPDVGPPDDNGIAYVWEDEAEGWVRDVKLATSYFEPIVFQDSILVGTDSGIVYEEADDGTWSKVADLPTLPQGPGTVFAAAVDLPRLVVAYDDVYLPSPPPDDDIAIYERDAQGGWSVIHHHEAKDITNDVAIQNDTVIATGISDRVFHPSPEGTWALAGTLAKTSIDLGGGNAVLSEDRAAVTDGEGEEVNLYPVIP